MGLLILIILTVLWFPATFRGLKVVEGLLVGCCIRGGFTCNFVGQGEFKGIVVPFAESIFVLKLVSQILTETTPFVGPA